VLADLGVLAAVLIAVVGPSVAPHVDVPPAKQLPHFTDRVDGLPPLLRSTTAPAAGPVEIPEIGPSVVLDPDTGSMVTRTRTRTTAAPASSSRSSSSSAASTTTALPGLPVLTDPPAQPSPAGPSSSSSSDESASITEPTEPTAPDCADPAVVCVCELDPLIDCDGHIRLTTSASTPPEETTPEVQLP
jgi:hypothetical protein